MKIVIFTTKNHIYANKIIKELLIEKKIDINLIIESTILYPGYSRIDAVKKYIKTSGIKYVTVQAFKVLFFQIGSFLYPIFYPKNYKHLLYPYKKIIKDKNLILKTNDINNKQIIELIKKTKADLLVSVLSNQIISKDLIKIPKYGTINIHPALLPSYRGVSPTFWVLANNEKKTGISIHSITSKEIDKGKLLAQEEVFIYKSDSEHSLYLRCVKKGIPLLISLFHTIIQSNKKLKPMKKGIPSSYYSLPTKKAINEFYKNGRSFYTLKELFYEK